MDYAKDEIVNVKISSLTVRDNQKVNVCLEIAEDIGFIDEANILIGMQNNQNEEQIPMKYLWTQNNKNYFTCNINFKYTGLYYFCIKIKANNKEFFVSKNHESNDAVIMPQISEMWTITAYDHDFFVPDWAKGKVMYQIFVDRFYKSNKYKAPKIENRITKKWGQIPEWKVDLEAKYNNIDFFMGNLQGIKEKIPYLKNLGVQILYLSPICKSQSNHRYDVSDYEEVDPYLGTNDDLKELCKMAHKSGIKVIVDSVFNHTGNDSKYFNEYGNYDTVGAFQSIDSEYYNWYKHTEDGGFKYWWGFKNLPVCDGKNEEWRNYICGKDGVIDKWFKLGIDGLRLDVADELEEEFIEDIRMAVKRNKKDGFIIGEVWENAITKEKNGVQRKYLLGKGLDSVMNYPFTNAILKYVRFGNTKFFADTVNEILAQYPKDAIKSLMNSLSTHDITRAITTLVSKGINENSNLIWDSEYDREWQAAHDKLTKKEYEVGKKMFKIATIIQYFLPGNACIYYGDEIGMYGFRDPFNRKCFNWKKVGNELNEFFVQIGKLKNKYKMLENADLKIDYIDERILAFERFDREGSLKIIVNRSNEEVKFGIKELLNGKIIMQEKFDFNTIGGYGFAILKN